jgi:hypothetical protein
MFHLLRLHQLIPQVTSQLQYLRVCRRNIPKLIDSTYLELTSRTLCFEIWCAVIDFQGLVQLYARNCLG